MTTHNDVSLPLFLPPFPALKVMFFFFKPSASDTLKSLGLKKQQEGAWEGLLCLTGQSEKGALGTSAGVSPGLLPPVAPLVANLVGTL